MTVELVTEEERLQQEVSQHQIAAINIQKLIRGYITRLNRYKKTTHSTLMVCHSTGDTNAIIEAAKVISTTEPVHILTIGEVAKRLLSSKLGDNIFVVHIDEIISSSPESYENGKFTEEQLQSLLNYFFDFTIQRVLIGTPSKLNAETFLQIAELFANNEGVVTKAILNDYLFHEPEHTYWLKLHRLAEMPEELAWLHSYRLLVPVLEVQRRIQVIVPEMSVSIVGHTIFNSSTVSQSAHVRNQLNVQENEVCLFVSGSKDQSADLALLQEVFERAQSQSDPSPPLKIMIGLHPGIESISEYLDQLDRLINEYHLTEQVKYILTDKILNRLGETTAAHGHEITANVSGNDAVKVSDGVASVFPASLANQAYIDGIPVYIQHDIERAYLLPDSGNDLDAFFAKVLNKVEEAVEIEGLPDQPVGDAIRTACY